MPNEERCLSSYEALKTHVAETGHFPDKHSKLNNLVRYQRKCIKAGTLSDNQKSLFLELAVSRSNSHTGGRRNKSLTTDD